MQRLFLAHLSKRERILFSSTAIVILLSLVYNFLLAPLGGFWSGLNAQVFDKEIELRKNLKYLKLKDKVEKIYLNYADYAKKVLDEEEVATLLSAVERQAKVSQIHLASVRPKPVKDLVFCKKYALELTCEAAMENYVEFIYKLQSSTKSIRIEKLKITSQGKNSPRLKAQILLTQILAAH